MAPRAGRRPPSSPLELAMHVRRALATGLIVVAPVATLFASAPVLAQDSIAASVYASQTSLAASGMIVDGSIGVIQAGSDLVVTAVRPLADASVIVLRDLATGSEVSVRISSEIGRSVSLAVGESVVVVAEATGSSLIAFGKLIAFIPNEVGRALLYQARSTQR
ncbi:MAG: hypothetical protein ABI900_04065 [Betaproteobacteria bacterium]